MSEVLKLGITAIHNRSIQEVDSIDVIANQGIVGDRHFKKFNDPYNQISLIESEGIDNYNIKFGLNISYLEAVYLGSITFLGNLFLPLRSGANFRLIYEISHAQSD